MIRGRIAIAGFDHFHRTIVHGGAGFTQVARDRGDQPPLLDFVVLDREEGDRIAEAAKLLKLGVQEIVVNRHPLEGAPA